MIQEKSPYTQIGTILLLLAICCSTGYAEETDYSVRDVSGSGIEPFRRYCHQMLPVPGHPDQFHLLGGISDSNYWADHNWTCSIDSGRCQRPPNRGDSHKLPAGNTVTVHKTGSYYYGGYVCRYGTAHCLQRDDLWVLSNQHVLLLSNDDQPDDSRTLAVSTVKRAFHTSTLIDDEIFHIGGVGPSQAEGILVYDINSNTWRFMTTSPLYQPLWGHSAVEYNRRIFIFGGRAGERGPYSGVVYGFDPFRATILEYPAPDTGLSPRNLHASMILHRYGCAVLVVTGGQNSPHTTTRLHSVMGVNKTHILNHLNQATAQISVVTSLSGCVAKHPNVINCPPEGGVILTLHGRDLESPHSTVTVGGHDWPIISRTVDQIKCALPHARVVVAPVVLQICGKRVEAGTVHYRQAAKARRFSRRARDNEL